MTTDSHTPRQVWKAGGLRCPMCKKGDPNEVFITAGFMDTMVKIFDIRGQVAALLLAEGDDGDGVTPLTLDDKGRFERILHEASIPERMRRYCINRKKNPQGFCCHAHWKECHPVV